ncbi:MAG: hypothetical protein ABIK28_08050 [Planctomycetota bacterium]
MSIFVGLDLGQSQDYTALAIIEKTPTPDGSYTKDLKKLQRFELGTSYAEIVERIGKLMQRQEISFRCPKCGGITYSSSERMPGVQDRRCNGGPKGEPCDFAWTSPDDEQYLNPPTLIVDATGVGAPVIDYFKKAGIYPKAIKIHGGEKSTSQGNEYHVPKRDLVAALQVDFQAGHLKIADSSHPGERKLLEKFEQELMNFKMKISQSGHDSYESMREGIHDDLVVSVAMASWYIKFHSREYRAYWV